MRAAEWIGHRLHPFCQDTGSVVPEGLERYVRVFHPVEREEGRREHWSDIAARNGRVVHPEMQLHAVSRPVGVPSSPEHDSMGSGYRAGSLPPEERAVLVEHLRRATSAPERCWFCVWEGWGAMDLQGVEARVRLPSRAYVLAVGSIDDVVPSALDGPFDQSPSLWWPDDRAWFVATEIDYMWTYVGGSAALVEVLLEDARLEALPASLTDKPFHDSDRLNAALDG